MEFKKFGKGPRAELATLTGAGRGVTSKPGPRQEKIPDKIKKVHFQGLEKPPKLARETVDPFHGDIGVTRKGGRMTFGKLMEQNRKALKSVLRDVRKEASTEVGHLLDEAMKRLDVSNVLVQEIFAPLPHVEFESPYSRMFRMVHGALARVNAAELQSVNPVEFPFEQHR